MTGSGRGSGQGGMMEEVTFSLTGGDVLHWNYEVQLHMAGPSLAGKGSVGANRSALSFFVNENPVDRRKRWPHFSHLIHMNDEDLHCGAGLRALSDAAVSAAQKLRVPHDSGSCSLVPSGWLWLLSILQILGSGLESPPLKMSMAVWAADLLTWEIVPRGM